MDTPVLVFDDDCGFCTYWADVVAARSDVRIVGFSELDPELLARLPEDYEECSHFVTDDEVRSCGASMEAALARTDVVAPARPVLERLGNSGTYRSLREWTYQCIADNRGFFGTFTSKTPPVRRDDDETAAADDGAAGGGGGERASEDPA